MAQTLPYVLVGGTLARILEKIKTASVPTRFTQDFLSTKLGFKAGNAKAVIPFFKRIGFIGPDGAPTDLYKRFRNPAQSGPAMAEAIQTGFAGLYEMNEYVHSSTDADLKGLVVQATGAEPNSRVVQAIVSSFKALKGFANFDATVEEPEAEEEAPLPSEAPAPLAVAMTPSHPGLNLSYTINLNLPATTDIKVFDAIFKSLREHLLRR